MMLQRERLGNHKWRVLALAPLLIVLTAARSTMIPIPETLISGANKDSPVGAFDAHVGDVVMRGTVLVTETANITAPISVSIARFSTELASGSALTPVIASDATATLIGSKGDIYCGEDQRARSKFGEAMIGDWFSKFESVVRFCFVDADSNGTLDGVFLGGAKDKEFLGVRPIEPVPIEKKFLQPSPDQSEMRLVLKKIVEKTGKLELELQLWRGGERQLFDYLLSAPPGVKPRQVYPHFKHDPKKSKYPIEFRDVLGGQLAIDSVDLAAKTARIRVKDPIGPVLFKPVLIQIQTIYVYVYHG